MIIALSLLCVLIIAAILRGWIETSGNVGLAHTVAAYAELVGVVLVLHYLTTLSVGEVGIILAAYFAFLAYLHTSFTTRRESIREDNRKKLAVTRQNRESK